MKSFRHAPNVLTTHVVTVTLISWFSSGLEIGHQRDLALAQAVRETFQQALALGSEPLLTLLGTGAFSGLRALNRK